MTRNLQVLKPRQLAFSYYALCSSEHASPEVLKQMESKFVELPLSELNEHYLIKFLLGMHRKKFYSASAFTLISKAISSKIESLSNSEFLSFLKILN